MARLNLATVVTILNFEKYNPRKDVKSPSWFRLEHDLFETPDFFDFTHAELMAWIYLLCVASKKNSETFVLNWAHVERIGRIKKKDFESALEKLALNQVVHISVTDTSRARDVCGTGLPATDEHNERDETNITNETGVQNVDVTPESLMSLWNDKSLTLPKAEVLNEDRKRLAKKQITKYPTLEHWNRAIQAFVNSEFCMNEWKPGFDDFLHEGKRIKALEGKYSRKSRGRNFAQETTDLLREQHNRVLKGEL